MGDADLHTAAREHLAAWDDEDVTVDALDATTEALRAALAAATKPLTVADIPADVKALIDEAAGRQHTDDGAVMATFAAAVDLLGRTVPPAVPTEPVADVDTLRDAVRWVVTHRCGDPLDPYFARELHAELRARTRRAGPAPDPHGATEHDAQCEREWVTGRWGGAFTACGCAQRLAAAVGAPDEPTDTLDARIDHLTTLAPDWDSYGGEPISEKAIALCRELRFVPCSDGGVQIELASQACYAEVVIDRDGEITFATGGPK